MLVSVYGDSNALQKYIQMVEVDANRNLGVYKIINVYDAPKFE